MQRILFMVALLMLPGVAAAQAYRDCADCPEMLNVPAGRFSMGSPAGQADSEEQKREQPLREVTVDAFAIGKYEVTVGEFKRFVDATGYRTEAERNIAGSGCKVWDQSRRQNDWQAGRFWNSTVFRQSERHPVVCVSWNDTQAYVAWLSKQTGKRYRLPSEAEWEYATRAGTTTSRPWGNDPNTACRYANATDQSEGPAGENWNETWLARIKSYLAQLLGSQAADSNRHECRDGHFYTAPVGSYAPNSIGLYDTIGNAWEWVADCFHGNYEGAPTRAEVWTGGDCSQRITRGASWDNGPREARSARRARGTVTGRDDAIGFRVARSLQ